jgi:hypothetical protein
MTKHAGLSSEAFNAQKLHEAENAVRQQLAREMARAVSRGELEQKLLGFAQAIEQKFVLVQLNQNVLVNFLIKEGVIEKEKYLAWTILKQQELDAALAKDVAAQKAPAPSEEQTPDLIPTGPTNGAAAFAEASPTSSIILTD